MDAPRYRRYVAPAAPSSKPFLLLLTVLSGDSNPFYHRSFTATLVKAKDLWFAPTS